MDLPVASDRNLIPVSRLGLAKLGVELCRAEAASSGEGGEVGLQMCFRVRFDPQRLSLG